MKADSPEELRQWAWIGDAVLALYARRWILRNRGGMCAETFQRMTSNTFLASLGNPTKIEAEIGVIYEREGWDAAVAHIEARLIPLFEKQEAKRRRTKRA